MKSLKLKGVDEKIRDVFTVWNKIDEVDVKILEGLSLFGPRNLTAIAERLNIPKTTLRYRVKQMLENSLLFIHLNPYHTNMGLKKATVFIEAKPGYEDVLLESLRQNDFWIILCRIFGPYEGCGGTWTIPKENDRDFESFLENLLDSGVARSYDLNWTTCREGVPVRSRWFNLEEKEWVFDWDEWVEEVKLIEGELPWTLIETKDWPIRVDYEDVLIVKELEKDGSATMSEISRRLNIHESTVKYHFRKHLCKRGIIEGYEMEIARFPILFSDYMFFRFEFDSYEKFSKFTLSLHDKPFPISLGKVLGENSLISQIYLPRLEFRKFINALSKLIKMGLLNTYNYLFQDINQTWRQTIPYEHFRDGRWDYDARGHQDKIRESLEKQCLLQRP